MRYPHPLQFVRRVVLDPTSPRPRALFRSNHLNLKVTWGKPVPTLLDTFDDEPNPVLIFDGNYVPLNFYYVSLEETAHIHAATKASEINYEIPPKLAADYFYLSSQKGRMVQEALKDAQDRLACKLAKKLMETSSPADAFREAGARLGMDSMLVYKTLHDREGFVYTPEVRIRTRVPRDPSLPVFSRLQEHQYKLDEVKRMVQAFRTLKDYQNGALVLDDLAVPTSPRAPGGFPTYCPVTGLELSWAEAGGLSMYSPKIGMRDPDRGIEKGNLLLMSKFAKRVVSGTGDPKVLKNFLVYRAKEMSPSASQILYSLHKWITNNPHPLHTRHLSGLESAMFRHSKYTSEPLVVPEPPPTSPTVPTNPLPIYTPHPLPVTPTLINSGENLAVKYLT